MAKKMKKLTDYSKKKRKKMIEKIKDKGDRLFLIEKDGNLYPFCVMCGEILEGKPYMTGVLAGEDLGRNYVYAVCIECFPMLSDDKVIEQIEEWLMLVSSTRPHFKAKRKKGEG